MSSPFEIERFLLEYTKSANCLLDVATGLGKNGYIMRVFNKPKWMIGVDIYLPFLKLVKNHRVYDDVILCDVSKLPFINNIFDVVVASEILEHLEKIKGVDMLQEIDRVANKRLIVVTPNRPPRRGGLASPEGFNSYEAHISSWGVRELKSRGFIVYGLGLRASKYFGKVDWIINLLFFYSTFILPYLADELIAIKEKVL